MLLAMKTRNVMSLVRFDPSIVTVKQWCIISQIVGCPVTPVILRETGFLFLKVLNWKFYCSPSRHQQFPVNIQAFENSLLPASLVTFYITPESC